MSPRQVQAWAGWSAAQLRSRWGRDEVHVYGKVDSTNAVASQLADAGAPEGTLVVAREQARGRGRLERTWHSPPDKGVYLSLVLRPEGRPASSVLSILAGLGIVQELDERFPALDPALKWPNDLMAGNRKLGGILGEAIWAEAGPRYVVLGVGVNVKPMGRALPRELERAVSCVEEFQPGVELVQVADAVVRGLESRLRPAPDSLDPSALSLLDRYDWLRDRRVRVRSGADEDGISGRAVGIAPDGALLFRPDRGALRRVVSAVVTPEEDA
ncbi:MAG: biotin--[acetyl-CoA-carboxylase] ligase [Gemmatimonadota bacterium]